MKWRIKEAAAFRLSIWLLLVRLKGRERARQLKNVSETRLMNSEQEKEHAIHDDRQSQ
jgi:hypothetical protein